MSTENKSSSENSRGGLREFVEREVVQRYPKANDKLRAHVTGLLKILDVSSGKVVYVDFAGQEAKLLDNESRTPDCTLECTDKYLERITQGDLNPQLAMLSGKVKVSGKTAIGIYFFNLLVND